MSSYVCMLLVLTNVVYLSSGITTIHHDKPEESSISVMATSMTNPKALNITLTSSERQKRLLPYVNFYQTNSYNKPDNQIYNEKYQPPPKKVYTQYNEYQSNPDTEYRSKIKYTPFLESNVIPGPFKPMAADSFPSRIKVQFDRIPQNNNNNNKVPNFGELYDKLAQLKLSQNYRRPTYVQIKRPVPQQDTYVLKPQFYNRQKLIQPTKTTFETYTATNIDIPSGANEQQYHYSERKPYINAQIAVEVPYSSVPQDSYNNNRKPFIIVPANQEQPNKQYIIVHRKPVLSKKPVTYELPKYIQVTPQYEDQYQIVSPKYEDVNVKYEEFPRYDDSPKYVEESTPAYANYQPQSPSKNVIDLSTILKHLQSTNTLPKTLTPENIDNSIKTLMKILTALKKHPKSSKPIVVHEEPAPDYVEDDVQNEAGVGISGHPNELPGAVNEAYPEDTDEGGTPGKPGVDYPALSSIPQTSFNCKTQRYKGFFGDPDTHCQVWHYCDLNGGQASFLCPNGTIFSQVALTCDWWYNVKCSSTAQLYVLNERLYKYIIPLSPKFPEDYTGPLVDKYLALKFQEMEEKMRKEKKGKGNADKSETEDSSDREDAISDNTEKESFVEVSTKVSKMHEKETLDTVEDDNIN